MPLGRRVVHGLISNLVQTLNYKQLDLIYAELKSRIAPISQVCAAADKREVIDVRTGIGVGGGRRLTKEKPQNGQLTLTARSGDA